MFVRDRRVNARRALRSKTLAYFKLGLYVGPCLEANTKLSGFLSASPAVRSRPLKVGLLKYSNYQPLCLQWPICLPSFRFTP
jgi:hypothetical protein